MNFTASEISMIQEIIKILTSKKLTITFAESCTGGRLSALLVTQPGVSSIFHGSIVSYANSVKSELLGVASDILKDHGAVSRECALAMALGVKNKIPSDIALAVSGIAGPSGGTSQKPVGLVCFAIVGPGFEWEDEQKWEGFSRTEIQSRASEYILQSLLKFISTK